MNTTQEYVFSFANTTDAIQAEYQVSQNAIQVKVMPLPPEISAGCGICLRIPFDDNIKEKTLLIFTENKLKYQNIFIRIENTQNLKSTYKEVT